MLKDERLDSLAKHGANVAQFASFDPQGNIRFARVRELPKIKTEDLKKVISFVLERGCGSANIRTFLPEKPDGNPFEYGLTNSEEIAAKIRAYASQGYYTILNETIDIHDGGLSGVLFGKIMEGAPKDTPRCVEKPGCMLLPRSIGFQLINAIYGFHFHTPYGEHCRIEFSVHPAPTGHLRDNQIIWQVDEYEDRATPQTTPQILWPNKYSEFIGDKTFGLLIAYLLGFPVPFTRVFARGVPMFNFGAEIGKKEPVWVRTAPRIQTPGRFKTKRGWLDPFEIMQKDDPDNKDIAAILIQDGLSAEYSGSAITDYAGNIIVEGCKGYGDNFMLGTIAPDKLPQEVLGGITFIYGRLKEILNDIRFEWVYDGRRIWVVQLHTGKSETSENVVYPGVPKQWIDFDPKDGLEVLREMAKEVEGKNIGIVVRGHVGITSHVGDILRRAKIPSYIDKR
ncbi:MAG: hypothetical protein Q8O83_00505 [bacterium]|nr:hypothetical protein [bacterium]